MTNQQWPASGPNGPQNRPGQFQPSGQPGPQPQYNPQRHGQQPQYAPQTPAPKKKTPIALIVVLAAVVLLAGIFGIRALTGNSTPDPTPTSGQTSAEPSFLKPSSDYTGGTGPVDSNVPQIEGWTIMSSTEGGVMYMKDDITAAIKLEPIAPERREASRKAFDAMATGEKFDVGPGSYCAKSQMNATVCWVDDPKRGLVNVMANDNGSPDMMKDVTTVLKAYLAA